MQKIKDFVKGLLAKTLAWLKKIWLKIWKFLKKWGLHMANLLVLGVAYGALDPVGGVFAYFIVGFWIFLLLAYYIFWKLCRAETLFEKKDEPILPI